MKTIILIPCCKKKRIERCKAKDMYISQMFKMRLKYAEQLNGDIYILSAKYGLLGSETIIDPYDLTLKEFSKEERVKWSSNVVKELEKISSLSDDKYVILASNFYIEYILPFLTNYELPLSFCSDKYIGKKMQWLKEHIEEQYLLF